MCSAQRASHICLSMYCCFLIVFTFRFIGRRKTNFVDKGSNFIKHNLDINVYSGFGMLSSFRNIQILFRNIQILFRNVKTFPGMLRLFRMVKGL